MAQYIDDVYDDCSVTSLIIDRGRLAIYEWELAESTNRKAVCGNRKRFLGRYVGSYQVRLRLRSRDAQKRSSRSRREVYNEENQRRCFSLFPADD